MTANFSSASNIFNLFSSHATASLGTIGALYFSPTEVIISLIPPSLAHTYTLVYILSTPKLYFVIKGSYIQ
jgi:hypothetical protein